MTSEPRIAAVRLDQVQFHPHNVRRDLGDLRTLTDSIRRFGVMQPVVLENRGDHLRVRAGHRRVAAARLAGLARIPAVIHGESLATDEWLVHAVQENVMRRGLDMEDRRQTVKAMRSEGMSWDGIAEAFGVSASTARSYAANPRDPSPLDEREEGEAEKVEVLTREGRSAAQIADQLHVSPRTVVRIRNGHRGTRNVTRAALREFVAEWREREDANASDVLDALAAFTETGRLQDGAA